MHRKPIKPTPIWPKLRAHSSAPYADTKDSSSRGPEVPFRKLHEDLKGKEKGKESVAAKEKVSAKIVEKVKDSEVSLSMLETTKTTTSTNITPTTAITTTIKAPPSKHVDTYVKIQRISSDAPSSK